MLAALVYAGILALVAGQDMQSTTVEPTIHPTHAHHTKPPAVEHTVNITDVVFFQDLPNKVIVLKSNSGCYLTHLTDHQLENIKDAEKLLHLEAEIIHHVRNAKNFHLAPNPDKYSAAIQSACPKLYGYHH